MSLKKFFCTEQASEKATLPPLISLLWRTLGTSSIRLSPKISHISDAAVGQLLCIEHCAAVQGKEVWLQRRAPMPAGCCGGVWGGGPLASCTRSALADQWCGDHGGALCAAVCAAAVGIRRGRAGQQGALFWRRGHPTAGTMPVSQNGILAHRSAHWYWGSLWWRRARGRERGASSAANVDAGGDAVFGACSDNLAAKDDGSKTCLSTAMAEASLIAAPCSMLIW
jgi:hypothetical protein